MPLTVLLAHSGRTLELECTARTTVEEVQQAVAALTGVAVADQILTCEGAPLTAGKPLSMYGLAEGGSQQEGKSLAVFLYSRSLLRPDAPFPPPEHLPELADQTEPFPGGSLAKDEQHEEEAAHPLDEASSPLLRALPQYRRQFRQHLRRGRADASAGSERAALCARIVGEAEVVAASVDAALASVEPHYAFICAAQSEFLARFSRRYAHHEDVLTHFDSDLDFLTSVDLPQALCATGRSRLSDLVDAPALRSLAAECARSHRRFAARVAELEGLHGELRSDVEALFMRAPCVDLEELGRQLAQAQALAEEQDGVAQALAADAARAEALLEAATTGAPSASTHLSDTISMLEAMHDSHAATALPRNRQCGAAIEAFAERCVAAKNALAADALRALRTVASQQSKIREMREALAPFPPALDRQDADVARLLMVRRLPAAYKQCLAECARRAAFGEKYAAFAADLAERMGRFRHKEAAVRTKFRRHVEGLVPDDVLAEMGLDQPPPHCQVSVPGDERARLLPVTTEDLRRLQLPRPAALGASAMEGAGGRSPGGASAGSGGDGAGGREEQEGTGGGDESGAGGDDYGATSSLQLENARLRAELASQVALDCIRVAEMAAMAPPLPPASPTPEASPRQPGSASGSTSGAGQQQQLVLGADAAVKFERAIAAKDAVIAGLRSQMAAALRQAAACEARVRAVEQLTLQHSHVETSAGMASSTGAAALPMPDGVAPRVEAAAGKGQAELEQHSMLGCEPPLPGSSACSAASLERGGDGYGSGTQAPGAAAAVYEARQHRGQDSPEEAAAA